MQRIPVVTKDGSHTLSIPEMKVTYHSVHGAIRESMHVFIEAGWKEVERLAAGRGATRLAANLHQKPSDVLENSLHSGSGPVRCSLLEMGFGTGLNALLTLIEAEKTGIPVHYTSLEIFPISAEEAAGLNYCAQLNRPDLQTLFEEMHRCAWETDVSLSPYFILCKRRCSLLNFSTSQLFSLAYYDAFAPKAQPELWTPEVFQKLYGMMREDGVLVTYCSKGDVRRALQAAGFTVEKIPGPPGKREMVRARIAAG